MENHYNGYNLRCEHCHQDTDMHQIAVRIIERDDDSPKGLQVSVARGSCTIMDDITQDLGRRQSVAVDFLCLCEGVTTVSLVQHSGATVIEAEAKPKDYPCQVCAGSGVFLSASGMVGQRCHMCRGDGKARWSRKQLDAAAIRAKELTELFEP